MDRSGNLGGGSGGIYIPRDPNHPVIDEATQIWTGPPSQYVDPAAVQAAPFNPNASPIEARQMPYQPAPPPESWDLEDQPKLMG